MPITYSIDQEKRAIFEVWQGEITASELGAYWRRYLADPQVILIRRTLVDLRNGAPRFSGEQLSDLVESIVVPMLEGRKWKSALLVARPVQHGVSRQYNIFAATYSQDQIFTDRDAALRWLLEKN